MCRTRYPFFLFMVSIVSLAYGVAAPSLGRAQSAVQVGGREILLGGIGRIDSFAWSPDGSKIAVGCTGSFDGQFDRCNALYVMNPDGTNPIKLPRTPLYHEVVRAWSPDGSRIAFDIRTGGTSIEGLGIMNADGTNPLYVVLSEIYRDGGLISSVDTKPYYNSDVTWSPDGSKIAYTCDPGRNTGPPAYSPLTEICAANDDGDTNAVYQPPTDVGIPRVYNYFKNPVSLTDTDSGIRLTDNLFTNSSSDPSWSPDGSKIAYTCARLNPPYFTTGICVMNADGTNPVRLTGNGFRNVTGNYRRDNLRDPSWSPDGSKIAAVCDGRSSVIGGLTGVCVMNADGTNLVLVYDVLAALGDMAWSPDGSKIAYLRNGSERESGNGIFAYEFPPHRGELRATLLRINMSSAWVHLYCLKDRTGLDADPPAPCVVTFECNDYSSGEPAAWWVEVAPKTIFTYWPNKTVNGRRADFRDDFWVADWAGDPKRGVTCEVFSPDPITVRSYTYWYGPLALVPVAEPARPDIAAEPGERHRQATLPNLSPRQALVHLYCLKERGPDAGPCAVTFECNGFSGEPVAWPVEVAPKTLFYYREYFDDDTDPSLEAALIAAGKPEDEARRRTTCEVSSADPIAVRGYTRFNGQSPFVPVTAY